MMETLAQRLNDVQEELLALYEEDSEDIDKQILQWELIKKENVLFHYARSKGIYRLQMQLVPALQVSQDNAKKAIEMALLLKKLKASKYGAESWTLQDTSRELFETPPKRTFKKNGYPVEVRYDSDPNNTMQYTGWDKIYYETDETFELAKGEVDYEGCFYKEGNVKIYYIRFNEDAAKYSTSGEWEVLYKNDQISPVASVSSTTSDWDIPDSGVEQRERSPVHVRGPLSRRSKPTTVHSPGSPNRRRPQKTRRGPLSAITGRRRHQAQEEERPRGERRQEEGRQGDSRQHPELPEGSSQTLARGSRTQRGRSTRLEQLLRDQADPPIVVLAGGANQLKCLRYRFTHRHRHLFTSVSTTWNWVRDGRNDNAGSRIIVSFLNSEQRNTFLGTVSIPRGVGIIYGSLQGL